MKRLRMVWDGAAIGVSGICLVHCMVLPVVTLAVPVLSAWNEHEWVHVAFVLAAAPLSLIALMQRVHGQRASRQSIAAAAGGLALLVTGALSHGVAEVAQSICGSLLLIWAHGLNWRRARRISCNVAG